MTRELRIQSSLNNGLLPSHLEVTNESHMHNVPKGSETHFKVVVASERFGGQSMVQRHRAVQQLLSEEFKQGLHALALHTFTPEEWQQKSCSTQSPLCLGGSGH